MMVELTRELILTFVAPYWLSTRVLITAFARFVDVDVSGPVLP